MSQITKIERIIFMERDLSSMESCLRIWEEYANGFRDLHSENKYILDNVHDEINRIKTLIEMDASDSKKELNYVIDNFYDENYYDYDSAKECADYFINNYADILQTEALKKYNEEIICHSPENATNECERLRDSIRQQQDEISAAMKALNFIEKCEIKLLRRNPNARVNSSPSFQFIWCGEKITEGLANGMKDFQMNGIID